MGEICEPFSKMLPSRLTCNSSEGKVIQKQKKYFRPKFKGEDEDGTCTMS
jgi:hypothetical protein